MGRSVQLDIDGLSLRLQHNQDEQQLLDLAKAASSRIQNLRRLAPRVAQQQCILTVLLQVLQELSENQQQDAALKLALERTREENRFLREQILKAAIVKEEENLVQDEASILSDISHAQQNMEELLADLPNQIEATKPQIAVIKNKNLAKKPGISPTHQRSLGRNPLLERQKSNLSPTFHLPGLQQKTSSKEGKKKEKQNAKNKMKNIIFEPNGQGDSLFERQLNYWQGAILLG